MSFALKTWRAHEHHPISISLSRSATTPPRRCRFAVGRVSRRSEADNRFSSSGAKGLYLYDVDGNHFIDYVMFIRGSLHYRTGAHAKVIQAIQQTALKGTSYRAPSPLELDLAKSVMDFMPNIEMLRFVNSGTEATMSTLRLAHTYAQHDKII